MLRWDLQYREFGKTRTVIGVIDLSPVAGIPNHNWFFLFSFFSFVFYFSVFFVSHLPYLDREM